MLYIAIYNDQGWISRYWRGVKQLYNRSAVVRGIILALHAPYLYVFRATARKLAGRSELQRGMSLRYDRGLVGRVSIRGRHTRARRALLQ